MEKQNEGITDKPLLTDSLRALVNEGIILGLKESLVGLNHLLDKKVEEGLPEYLTRNELKTFLNTYTELCATKGEANFR